MRVRLELRCGSMGHMSAGLQIWEPIGVVLGLCWAYMGIMENKMPPTIMGLYEPEGLEYHPDKLPQHPYLKL